MPGGAGGSGILGHGSVRLAPSPLPLTMERAVKLEAQFCPTAKTDRDQARATLRMWGEPARYPPGAQ